MRQLSGYTSNTQVSLSRRGLGGDGTSSVAGRESCSQGALLCRERYAKIKRIRRGRVQEVEIVRKGKGSEQARDLQLLVVMPTSAA